AVRLGVPAAHLWAAPFPRAQLHLRHLPVYRTPRDKHIRRLSGAASAVRLGVPAAHLWAAPFPRAQLHLRHLPVYRTPRDKLVNALGGASLQGEALYWWTQFSAAVAYIKTMDYPPHS
ncbi:GTPase-activating protein and VPS9 domain-containing protein 1, partial [Operophtera brumata]